MSNVVSLNKHAAQRQTLKEAQNLVADFASHFSEDARKQRYRQALVNITDEMLAEFGADYALSEISGLRVIVESLKE